MIAYPPARRLDLVENLHGQPVADPYRWLEDPDAPDTQAWSAAQDQIARAALDANAGREWMRGRLRDLFAVGSVSTPIACGDRLFFSRRTAQQEHPVLLVREADGSERVLIDPSALSDDDTVTLDFISPSWEGNLLAHGLSEGGNEEWVLRVMDVDTGEIVDGPIDRTRFSPVAWLPGGEAFYYGRRLPPEAVPPGEEAFHRRIYRHRVGSDPANDELVFGEGLEKTNYYWLSVSRDRRWLLIGASAGTAPRNDLYLADLAGEATFRPVLEGVDAQTFGSVEDDGRLYLFTTLDAPKGRIVVADPTEPEPARWTELVAESDAVIDGFLYTEGRLVVSSTRWAVAELRIHDAATGARIRDVTLPGVGATIGLSSRPEGGDDVWFGYTDFLTPPEVHHLSVSSGEVQLWERAPGGRPTTAMHVEQVWYESLDGTRIPMFLIKPEGATADQTRPTILTGYGGFNNAMTPAYAVNALAWVEAGGVYAIAGLRGGSEGGEEWHRAGRRERKQNVFDDFHAAAEWLTKQGWTDDAHLAINGGSNGGLLVGAALTQRPDLYRSVVCSAPLLDMVRYEHFGLGRTWNDEYGTAEDPEEFAWLYAYSPYHHVVEATYYPAVLFTLFESDSRVDPLHGRKLCAALQHATSASPGKRPILLRREVNVGHAGRSISRTVELAVDVLTFQAAQVGLALPPA